MNRPNLPLFTKQNLNYYRANPIEDLEELEYAMSMAVTHISDMANEVSKTVLGSEPFTSNDKYAVLVAIGDYLESVVEVYGDGDPDELERIPDDVRAAADADEPAPEEDDDDEIKVGVNDSVEVEQPVVTESTLKKEDVIAGLKKILG